MTRSTPSFLSRIAIACGSFFAILGRADFAAAVEALRAGAPLQPAPPPAPAPAAAPAAAAAPVPAAIHEVPHEAALQLLGLLQRDARFIDFIEEDIAAYPDADIGAAARLVHEGCRKVLREHFSIMPVRSESEGSRITLPAGFDAAAVRVTGKVVGAPPFKGSLSHRGWRITDTRLPSLSDGHDAAILAQAEVEL